MEQKRDKPPVLISAKPAAALLPPLGPWQPQVSVAPTRAAVQAAAVNPIVFGNSGSEDSPTTKSRSPAASRLSGGGGSSIMTSVSSAMSGAGDVSTTVDGSEGSGRSTRHASTPNHQQQQPPHRTDASPTDTPSHGPAASPLMELPSFGPARAASASPSSAGGGAVPWPSTAQLLDPMLELSSRGIATFVRFDADGTIAGLGITDEDDVQTRYRAVRSGRHTPALAALEATLSAAGVALVRFVPVSEVDSLDRADLKAAIKAASSAHPTQSPRLVAS